RAYRKIKHALWLSLHDGDEMQNTGVSATAPLIAILAGEDSGDQLGADLIVALRQRYPQARFVGIGGARMQREGFESWYDIRELSLVGFSEVISHLPRLLRLRRSLVARLRQARPAGVSGIYARHGIDARFVGHPLADRFALVADRVGAREALHLPQQAPVLAVLPGSRM